MISNALCQCHITSEEVTSANDISGMDEDIRLSMQDQLVDVIMWVLVTHPELHYYQVCYTCSSLYIAHFNRLLSPNILLRMRKEVACEGDSRLSLGCLFTANTSR